MGRNVSTTSTAAQTAEWRMNMGDQCVLYHPGPHKTAAHINAEQAVGGGGARDPAQQAHH